MLRLTDTAKPLPGTFRFCQICGYSSREIVEFRLLQECDDADVPEAKFLIRCKSAACVQTVEDHPRLYRTVEWGAGEPGSFILLCGDCEHRNGFACTSPELKANGGEGLAVSFGGLDVHVSYSDGTGGYMPRPAVRCAGKSILGKKGEGGGVG